MVVHELIPIGQLAVGQSGQIEQLLGRPEDVHRLQELGLRQGETVEMVRPGSPCIVKRDGNRFCFRDAGALHVLVRPGDGQ